MNKILSPAERRALKARAHPLKPTVMIGNDGLSASVLQEIDSTLKSHELIKIKVDHDDSDEREDMLGLICASTGASAIDHIGKVLVVYRERPQSAKFNAPGAGPGGRGNAQRGKGGGRNGAATAQPGQAQASPGQGAEGQRKPAKKAAGAVWTKVRQQRGRKGSGRSGPGGGGPSRGQGGGGRGGNGGNSGGNRGSGGNGG